MPQITWHRGSGRGFQHPIRSDSKGRLSLTRHVTSGGFWENKQTGYRASGRSRAPRCPSGNRHAGGTSRCRKLRTSPGRCHQVGAERAGFLCAGRGFGGAGRLGSPAMKRPKPQPSETGGLFSGKPVSECEWEMTLCLVPQWSWPQT